MQGLNELSFKALRLFVAVLDHGSFSEVARREGLAPSSISRQVQLMEQARLLEEAIDRGETDLDVALARLQRDLDALMAALLPWTTSHHEGRT